jgi:hypothetical protein
VKPEYQDYYKFIVSLGLVLISFSILVPWLVLSESTSQQLSISDIAALPQESQDVVKQSQNWMSLLVNTVPVISLASFVSGLLLFMSGAYQWYKRQRKIDSDEELKSKKLKQEVLGNMTADEIAKKALSELGYQKQWALLTSQKMLTANSGTNHNPQGEQSKLEDAASVSLLHPNLTWAKYLRMQQIIGDSIEVCIQGTKSYRLLRDRNFGQVQYNMILESKSKTGIDAVIEVRYADEDVQEIWVKDETGKIVMAADIYQQQAKRSKVIPTVVFVVDTGNEQDLSKLHYQETLRRELLGNDLYLKFMQEKQLHDWTAESVLNETTAILPPEIVEKIRSEKKQIKSRKEGLRKLWNTWSKATPRAIVYAFAVTASGVVLWGLYRIIPTLWNAIITNPSIVLITTGVAILFAVVWVIRESSAPIMGSISISDKSNGSDFLSVLRTWGGRLRIKSIPTSDEIKSISVDVPPRSVAKRSGRLEVDVQVLDKDGELIFEGVLESNTGRMPLSAKSYIAYKADPEIVFAETWIDKALPKLPIALSYLGGLAGFGLFLWLLYRLGLIVWEAAVNNQIIAKAIAGGVVFLLVSIGITAYLKKHPPRKGWMYIEHVGRDGRWSSSYEEELKAWSNTKVIDSPLYDDSINYIRFSFENNGARIEVKMHGNGSLLRGTDSLEISPGTRIRFTKDR